MNRLISLTVTLALAALICLSPAPIHARQATGQPLRIMRGDTLSAKGLTVQVPRTLNQVVLERRVGKSWKPVKVQHLKFGKGEQSKTLPVTLPKGLRLSQVRMMGYSNTKFPARFTKGARRFARPEPMTAGGGPMMSGGAGLEMMAVAPPSQDSSTETKAAVESDIWQIVGSQLFFFNQYRGLQVFDMTDPAIPVRTGTLRLAASGEQMYVLNPAGSAVALVGRSNSTARAGKPSLFVLGVERGVPTLTAEVPLQGSVLDSRLIGDTVYVLSSVWQTPGIDGNVSGYHLLLQAIDLAAADAPVVLPELLLQGNQGSLQAVAGSLLIGAYTWSEGTQVMHLVDIATASGAPALRKSFPVRGSIQDKFKMGLAGGAAVAVTHSWQNGRQETWVETFPLTGSETQPLAALELEGARNERLHATRFDGNRLYVVTFRQIDPLFVVDLADPAQPAVHGALEIPGWSTYLEPLGDRLLAVGVEGQRVTISLFDVADSAAPALLSRLSLGEEGTGSWSEAIYDEKAVEYAAAEGLLFVPFQAWTENGYQTAIQAIQVGRDGLTLDQTIPSTYQARRGTVLGNYFVTISGQELLVMDRTGNESTPEAKLSLAWRVDRVVPFGDYLLQLDDGPQNIYGYTWMTSWSATAETEQAMLRVTRTDDPDALIEEIELGVGRIVGTAQKDTRLLVAQWLPATTDTGATLRTTVLDIGSPPAVTEIATVDHPMATPDTSLSLDEVQGLWLGDDRLTWYLPGAGKRWSRWWGPVLIDGPVVLRQPQKLSGGMQTMAVADQPLPEAAHPNYTAALLCPLTLTEPATALPVIAVSSSQEVRDASPALWENGFVFFSYDTATALAEPMLPPGDGQMLRPYWPPQPMMQLSSNLQVVDFRHNTAVVRDPVSIPGQLLSVSQADAQGAVILTNTQTAADDATRRIQAAAYDGVAAWQLDERNLDVPFWTPSVSDGTRLFFARDEETPGVSSVGYDPASGRLRDSGDWTTTTSPASLNVLGPYLLASSYGVLELATITASGIEAGPVFATSVNLWLRVERTARSGQGLWIPANEYGVEFLPWSAASK